MGAERAIAVDAVERPARHRLTVREFLILDEAGVFGDKHVELIDGEIFVLSPIFLPHSRTLLLFTVAIDQAVTASGLPVIACSPVSAELEEHSLPEADLLIVDKGEVEGFVPRGATRIAIEVSDSTLRHDLGRKARLYARSGISEYWVVDVRGRKVIRLTAPEGEQYQVTDELPFGAAIPSVTLPGLVVDTARLTELG